MKITIEFELKDVYEFPKYINIRKLKQQIKDFFELLLRCADLERKDKNHGN